jgi:hypothetical protein
LHHHSSVIRSESALSFNHLIMPSLAQKQRNAPKSAQAPNRNSARTRKANALLDRPASPLLVCQRACLKQAAALARSNRDLSSDHISARFVRTRPQVAAAWSENSQSDRTAAASTTASFGLGTYRTTKGFGFREGAPGIAAGPAGQLRGHSLDRRFPAARSRPIDS